MEQQKKRSSFINIFAWISIVFSILIGIMQNVMKDANFEQSVNKGENIPPFMKTIFVITSLAFLGCSPIKKQIALNSISLVSAKGIKEAYIKYPHISLNRLAYYGSCTQIPIYPKDIYDYAQHTLLSDLFLAINFSSKEKIFYDYAKEDKDKKSKFSQYVFIDGGQNSPRSINFCPILKSVNGQTYNYLYFYPTKSKDKEGRIYDIKGDNNVTFKIGKSGYMFMERAMNTNEIIISKDMLDKLELP